MNRFFLLLSILGFAFTIFFFYLSTFPSAPPPYREKPFSNPYTQAISAFGIVEALEDNILIGTPVAGLISDVFVKVGDHVQANQSLFQLDARKPLAELEVKKLQVQVAEAELQKLQDQLTRLNAVRESSSISKETLSNRQNDVAIATLKLSLAKAELNEIVTQVEHLTILAPKEGIILTTDIHKGEYASTSPEKPLMILGDTRHLQVRVDIDEEQAGNFKPTLEAIAHPKNDFSFTFPLHFERVELYVAPKKQFTGSGREHIDTRVLQVIYRFTPTENHPIYVGQMLEVLIKVYEPLPLSAPAPSGAS